MVKVIVLLLSFVFISPSYGATIYHWVDKNGVVNFTDDYEKLPSEYRSQIHITVMDDAQVMESPGPASVPQTGPAREEARKAIPAQGEEWRGERGRAWETQLKEATENLKAAGEDSVGESENLVIRKYGSHQQFKSTILSLERIKEEETKYEAQIAEAKEMLKRFSGEAGESKSNPDRQTGVPAFQLTFTNRPEEKTDIYGRDEAWWREQMLAKREELKEAVQDYERAHDEYMKKVESLGPSRFGGLSLTQYQMMASGLEVLSDEMAKHQVRMTEINESIKKLTKETEESRANPEWLRQ
jgi:hypothetical protein